MSQPVSLVIVNSPYLGEAYLPYLIAALNAQTSRQFNVFWINQENSLEPLQHWVNQGQFESYIYQVAHPWYDNLCCWEVLWIVARIMQDPALGQWFSYLHKTCLPAPNFVASLQQAQNSLPPQIGDQLICAISQLHSPLTVEQLQPKQWLYQLENTPATTWADPLAPNHHLPPITEQPWQKNAFAMPSQLARQIKLFECVNQPLFFQDLFDIFDELPKCTYLKHIRWFKLHQTKLYHLNHPKAPDPFSPSYLSIIRANPAQFGHLSIYDLACMNQPDQVNEVIKNGVEHYLRYSEKGSLKQWLRALDRANLSV